MSPGFKNGPIDYPVILNLTYGSPRNITEGFFPDLVHDNSTQLVSPIGAITATLVALFLSSNGSLYKITHVVKLQNIFQWIFFFIAFIVTFPVFVPLIFYRCIVFCVLKLRSSAFASLMDGPDAVWNLQDPSKPIITVLAEVEAIHGPHVLLDDIRKCILKILFINPKLTWKRKHTCMGYSYWQMCSDFPSLEKHVRWITKDNESSGDHISMSELQLLISNAMSNDLPGEDSCWEILVSKQYLSTEGDRSGPKVFPVLFRIHHSLGDGVSLLELLLKHLCTFPEERQQTNMHAGLTMPIINENSKEQKNEINHIRLHNNSKEIKDVTRDIPKEKPKLLKEEMLPQRKSCDTSDSVHIHARSTLKTKRQQNKRGICELFVSQGRIKISSNEELFYVQKTKMVLSHIWKSICYLFYARNNLQKILVMLYSLNKVRKACEISILDSSRISGEKLVAWYVDSPEGSLFSTIKNIKSQIERVRFTDVFLTALSIRVEKYLKEKQQFVPDCISLVVPAHTKQNCKSYTSQHLKSNITTKQNTSTDSSLNTGQSYCNMQEESQSERVPLQNTFLLGILNLPIKTNGRMSSVVRVKKVSQNMDFMYNSGQLALHSFLLNWMANILPEPILAYFLRRAGQNTMVVSNLVGPKDAIHLTGNPVKNICFWVPHRGNTGISISILSYANRLQVGMMVDKNIMSSPTEVQNFLSELIAEVMKLLDENADEAGKIA